MSYRCNRIALALLLAASAFLASGAANAAKVGDKAAAFSVPSSTGKPISDKNFPGKTLVLFFYTGAFTNT